MVWVFVDQIEDNGLLGITVNYEKFNHNLRRFGQDYFDGFKERLNASDKDDLLDIMPCGRFICVIQETKSKENTFMMFVDVLNDEQKAIQASKLLLKYDDGIRYQELFLITFKEMESSYQKLYNEAQLTIDASFLN